LYFESLINYHPILLRTIYTSPIKALSNQKFRDFRETFESVGLLTGDIQLNPDASCLIMTTEILRSMLYRGAALLQDIEFVIFDEVHYINDADRGVVWEEVIIMLPKHITLIMLSATTPNTMEFANWVGRTRQGSPIYVISTPKRPVPLEHFLFTNRPNLKDGKKSLYRIVEGNSTIFNEAAMRDALATMNGSTAATTDGSKTKKPQITTATTTTNNTFRSVNQEKNLWGGVVYFLQKQNLLPVVAFTFSRRKCDENADSLGNLELNVSNERSAVHVFMQKCLSKLKGSDAELPQIVWLCGLLECGIAVHHSGLLPILKEAVEILFSRGLVKILFATETFAMGVNMPARTVVFSSLRKHDGVAFRFLTPGEYTQMAGRAGRRGKDPTGTVIILCPEGPPSDSTLRQMILGQANRLASQFRLTNQMIISLLRIESLRIEEMLRKSFSEDATQNSAPQHLATLQDTQNSLLQLKSLQCPICATDLELYYTACRKLRQDSTRLFTELLANFHASRHMAKLISPGTLVIVDCKSHKVSAIPAIVLKIMSDGLVVGVLDAFLATTPDVVYPPWHVINLPPSKLSRSTGIKTLTIPSRDIIRITQTKLKIPASITDKDTPGIIADFVQVSEFNEAPFPNFSTTTTTAQTGFELDELVIIRKNILNSLPLYTCHACPDLFAHYTLTHNHKTLTDSLTRLQFQLSNQNLFLMPEYENRVQLLIHLNYLDPAHTVQLKGRVACEINTVDPLILTELLFENAFGDLSAAECAAFLAGLVFQDRSSLNSTTLHNDSSETIESLLQRLLLQDNDEAIDTSTETDAIEPSHSPDYLINVTPGIFKTVKRLIKLSSSLSALQRDHGLGHLECGTARSYLMSIFNPALIRVVHDWSLGVPFHTLTTQITTVPEGSIVRCITRLDETCREAAGAGKIMGDPKLVAKMEEAAKLIRRDVCFASSLYI
jgi:antiviral helicase SKI2